MHNTFFLNYSFHCFQDLLSTKEKLEIGNEYSLPASEDQNQKNRLFNLQYVNQNLAFLSLSWV